MVLFYRDIINPSGIYAAIDTYDMGKVVEEAIKAITHKNCISSAISSKNNEVKHERKSMIISKKARMSGNEYYKAGQMQQAIRLYNQALAIAPTSSKEMILAYSNRSAVFFHKQYISACLKDIHACLALGCSGTVAEKLMKRREDASQLLFQEHVLKMIGNVYVPFFQLDDHNPDVPCVRSDVRFETDGVKKITADADIMVGSVVGVERAFVTFCTDNRIACYYCNKPELCLYPCEGCEALFCGEECQERCFKEYHCIECHIVDALKSERELFATRAAIKMSLMMTWDDFVAASTDMGATRLEAATVKQAFNSKEPLSVLSYTENERFMEGKMYNGSIQCAIILIRLLKFTKKYFPEEKNKRETVVLALGRVMLQLMVSFINIIKTQNTVLDTDSENCVNLKHSGQGLYSMSSKLKHSCEPNLLALGSNDTIHLVALRTIKRGEELTISYGGIFYDSEALEDATQKMNMLFRISRRMCTDCRVCLENWSSSSAVTIEMTKKQAALFKKLKSPKNIQFSTICDALDSFPYNSTQHQTAYNCFREFIFMQSYKYLNYFST